MDSQETRQLLSLLLFCSIVKINSFAVQEVATIIMHKLGKSVYPWANVQEKTLCMPHCVWQLAFALGELGRDTPPKLNPVILKIKINRFYPDFFLKTHYFHLY